jgi:hypothetical protein
MIVASNVEDQYSFFGNDTINLGRNAGRLETFLLCCQLSPILLTFFWSRTFLRLRLRLRVAIIRY